MSEIKDLFSKNILFFLLFIFIGASYAEAGEKIENMSPPANCGANWTEDIDVCRRCHNQSSGRDSLSIQSFYSSSDECGGNSTYVGPMQTETTSDKKLIVTHPDTTVLVGTNLCFPNTLKINGYAIAYYYYEDDVVKHEEWWPDADTTYTRRHFYPTGGGHNYKVKVIYCSNGMPSCGTGWVRLTKEWAINIGEGEINLAVPYYSQLDSTSWNGSDSTGWANEIYDSTDTTISRLGCALTDLVMVVRSYGIAYDAEGEEVNPKNMNNWLNGNKGYYPGGYIDWTKVATYSSDQVIYNHVGASFDTLDSDLKDNNPVILKVPRNIKKTHFVTVKGKTTDTYKINDPSSTTNVTLTAYDNQFDTIFDTVGTGGFRRFTHKTPEKGQMGVFVQCPVELLLTDPQGKRLGFDPITKTIVNDGLNGFYGAGDAVDERITDPGKQLTVDIEEGNYSLQTYGTGVGPYTLYIGIILPKLAGEKLEEVDAVFTGITREGAIADYPITITTSPETSKVEHIITLTSMKEDVEILFQLEEIDNEGIKNSLLKKLETAVQAMDKGDTNTIENILGAFKNEIEAQKGKHITEKGAKILLDDADYLVKHL
ncbi:MAG: C39 family peptidase [bacterium]